MVYVHMGEFEGHIFRISLAHTLRRHSIKIGGLRFSHVLTPLHHDWQGGRDRVRKGAFCRSRPLGRSDKSAPSRTSWVVLGLGTTLGAGYPVPSRVCCLLSGKFAFLLNSFTKDLTHRGLKALRILLTRTSGKASP